MGYALKNSQSFEEESCVTCGIVYYVPTDWQRAKRQTKAQFYCPNGHSLSYTELEAKRQALDAKVRERSANG